MNSTIVTKTNADFVHIATSLCMCMYGLFVPSVYLHALGFKLRHFTIYPDFISARVNLITSKLRKPWMGSVLGIMDTSHFFLVIV